MIGVLTAMIIICSGLCLLYGFHYGKAVGIKQANELLKRLTKVKQEENISNGKINANSYEDISRDADAFTDEIFLQSRFLDCDGNAMSNELLFREFQWAIDHQDYKEANIIQKELLRRKYSVKQD